MKYNHLENLTKPNCEACTLNTGNNKILSGSGVTESPDLFLIFENPESSEHYSGKQFSGRSAKTVHKVIQEISRQLGREITVYATYGASCRHLSDRPPSPHELFQCNGRLVSEISLVKPKTIILFGSNLCSALLEVESISKNRNKIHKFQGIPTIVTFSPKFVLNPKNHASFPSFVQDIGFAIEQTDPTTKRDWGKLSYIIVDDDKKCIDLFKLLAQEGEVCSLDIENTTGFNPYNAFILVTGIKHRTGTYIIPNEVFLRNKDHFDPNTHVIVHNAVHEYKFFNVHYGIRLTNIDDTMLMYHQIDERTNEWAAKDLKTLGQKILGAPDWDGPVKPYISKMQFCPKDLMHEYLAYDVDVTYGLYDALVPELKKDNVWDAYNTVVRPVIPFVNKMSANGILIDLSYVEEVEKDLTEDISHTQERFRDLVGLSDINMASPQQLAVLLYDEMQFPIQGGKRSTDEKTISSLIAKFPEKSEALDLIVEFRTLSKLLNTYVYGIYGREVNGVWREGLLRPDGRIHAEFRQAGTSTGRLSAELVQTIPKRKGPLIKRMFIPDEGMQLIEVDYKQLELRMGAHMSNDQVLIDYINSGNDMHTDMARLIFGIYDITPDQRFVAKSGNFGVMYRMDARAAFYNLKKEFPAMTMELANKIVDMPRDKFRTLFLWSTEMLSEAIKNHYTTTIFGRKRRFPLLTESNWDEVLKQMSNSGIQGSSSDLNSLCSMRCDRELPIKSHFLIHDAFLASIPMRFDPKEITGRMEDVPFKTNVKFEVDYKVMDRWGE
jgi:uracil-DNA glycosylase family 4